MKFFIVILNTLIVFVLSCSPKKNESTQLADSVRNVLAQQASITTVIDSTINTYEHRLDTKMNRKQYESKPNSLVTLQKWCEFGDTTKPVKIREEILTNNEKMEVIQYHFINNKLAQIHNYVYDKKWNKSSKQYMHEARYYIYNGSVKLSEKREAFGRPDSLPVIERAAFQRFNPGENFLSLQLDKLERISQKYAALPYIKRKS